MQLNTFFRLLLKLLFLYALFTPTVYALQVGLTVTPIEGASPLSVVLSARNTVVSPNEFIVGYKWKISGPENIVLGAFSKHNVTFYEPGIYTITLTIEETTNGGLGTKPEERNSATKSQVVTVYPPESELSNFSLLGNFSGILTSFYGIILNVNDGLFLSNESSFKNDVMVNVEVAFEVAPEHVGKQADLSVAVVYLPPDAKEQWYLKTGNTAFPFITWDLTPLPPPISVEKSINLSETQKIRVFSGHFENLTGKYKIYFAYSLLDGSGTMVHNFPNMPFIFDVTASD
ncbi:hypothetical protein [Candidatus Parabeggiatoa sp. HSG14]|uniref:hypothetical protein n=1 Tax=Candidatus Parabeggiatoa sp. HSG14 TaxID=3055593 RepID=UPI0025A8A8BE|nr:hypothetical protein [Thiotrichales bacterium HSG14]